MSAYKHSFSRFLSPVPPYLSGRVALKTISHAPLWPLYPGVSTRDCFRFRPRRFNMLLRFAWDPGYPVFLWISSKELSRSRCGAKDTKIRLSPGDKIHRICGQKRTTSRATAVLGSIGFPRPVSREFRTLPVVARGFNANLTHSAIEGQCNTRYFSTTTAPARLVFALSSVPHSSRRDPCKRRPWEASTISRK